MTNSLDAQIAELKACADMAAKIITAAGYSSVGGIIKKLTDKCCEQAAQLTHLRDENARLRAVNENSDKNTRYLVNQYTTLRAAADAVVSACMVTLGWDERLQQAIANYEAVTKGE